MMPCELAIVGQHVFALPIRPRRKFMVMVFDPAATATSAPLEQFDAVHDDFGNLTKVDSSANYVYHADDAPYTDEEHAALARSLTPSEHTPQPVAVEISTDEHGLLGRPLTEISIGRDERHSYSATYRLAAPGSDGGVLYLSQAQLAALLVAAEQLVKPARRGKRCSPRA